MDKLKIELTPVEKVNVKINGVDIGEFNIISKWEGLVKLQNKQGSIIAHQTDTIADKLFGELMGEKSEIASVVLITPSLIPDSVLALSEEKS